MTDSPDFNKLPDLTRDRLQSDLERFVRQVARVVPYDRYERIIYTSELDPNAKSHPIVDEVASWAGKRSVFLYYIRLQGTTDLNKIKKDYSVAKKKNGRNYARLNEPSAYFYVGSSKNIRQRLKDHLGYCSEKTYSLHLAYWARSLSLELEFVCAKYNEPAPREIYQALEDTLWEWLKPMFGRQGKR